MLGVMSGALPQYFNFHDNLSLIVSNIYKLHDRGPYGNLIDLKVFDFVVKFCDSTTQCDSYNHCNDFEVEQRVHNYEELHKESRPSMVLNKDVLFDHNIGFVTELTSCLHTGFSRELQANDQDEYFQAVTDILSSGRCNYAGERISLPSVFNWAYLEQELKSYHDKKLLDYLQFGFPLGLKKGVRICSNATNNHQSALVFPEAVDNYILTEKQHGALLMESLTQILPGPL